MSVPILDKARSDAGFTLVELLVTITLLALLTVGLHQGFRLGTRAADQISKNIERPGEIAIVYDFMQRELAAAEPLTATPDASEGIDFDGEPDSLAFAALSPAYLPVGGFYQFRVGLEPSNAGYRLIISTQNLTRGSFAPQPQAAQPSVLMDHVSSIAFSYLGEETPEQPAAWISRWTNRDILPQLIRLRIVRIDGSYVPDLVIAPRFAPRMLP